MTVEPTEAFAGDILIAIPHMDDGVLACGGTLARLADKRRVHLVYATDGMGSPAPVLPWRDSISADLGRIRSDEARAAMVSLGVAEQNIHFLDLPDGKLSGHAGELDRALKDLIERIQPAVLLIPFRYDRHPDHLAINRAATQARLHGATAADIIEYFVYYRWRLLPRGDVRAYIDPRHLLTIRTEAVRDQKRAALSHFLSQTTRYYPWQTRPNLTPELLDDVCDAPEVFLRFDPSCLGAKIFVGGVPWIRLTHRLEPFLKAWKDRAVALLRRALHSHD